jgi:hypothetical protein
LIPGEFHNSKTSASMKLKFLPAITLGTVLFTLPLLADTPQAGAIDFGKFSPSGDGQFVEVNVNGNLISMVARLAEKQQPDVAKLLRGIHAVRVNVIELNDENRAAMKERIEAVRGQLTGSAWERVVTAKEKNQDVGVFVKLRGEEAVEGIVVTVLDGDHEAVFVNVVGDIRPEQIAKVGETLNIQPLKEIGKKLDGGK